ncbi:Nif3-like dinuclear metal center hexameric protein [Flavitalea antarctica]
MNIKEVIAHLETIAPPSLQEVYDNAGLITGDSNQPCTGVIVCLDSTAEVINEAINAGANLVVAHHPIIFQGLKKLNRENYVGKAIILAIKHDIAIYAIHTNLDNIISGVNKQMADKLGLVNGRVLSPKRDQLAKLYVFVPAAHEEKLKDALFEAGAGSIGNYSECSFSTPGTGSFKGGEDTDPYVGKPGERHLEDERRIEVIFPVYLEARLLKAMRAVHPYEEVAFDVVRLLNEYDRVGSGLIGELEVPVPPQEFLGKVKAAFDLQVLRHTTAPDKAVNVVALCGGSGSFLINKALAAKADVYLTGDIKYHEFFDANDRMMICDIGHFESEQYTIDLLYDILREKFTNFAVLKTKVKTNPVHYFL